MAKDKYDITVEFKNGPDTTKMKKLTEEDVQRLLSTIPETKYHYGVKVLQALEEYEKAKQHTKKEAARLRLQSSIQKEILKLASDKDREAWVTAQDDYQKSISSELDAQISLKLAELKHDYLEDTFIAVRKQANMLEKQLDSEKQAQKYGQPT